LTWFTLVLILGLFQSVLLIIVLLTRYDKRQAPLLSLLGIISFGLALRLGYSPELYGTWIKWLLLGDVAILLFGPLFYDFVKSLLKLKTGFRDNWRWLHFLIAGLFLIHYVFSVLPYSSTELLIKEGQGVFHPFYTSFFIVGITSNLCYLGLSFRNWSKAKTKSRGFSFIRSILIFNGLILVSWLITFLISTINADQYLVVSYGYQLAFVFLALGVIAISYKALLGSSLWQEKEETRKYAKPSLTKAELTYWGEALSKLMSEDKLYLQSSLSLKSLGESVGLNKTQLSEAINRQFQKGFADWVNEYRIEEFIVLVESEAFSHLTFMGIATEVGFNTKATFNKTFKKVKGKSPSQYFAERGKKNLTEEVQNDHN